MNHVVNEDAAWSTALNELVSTPAGAELFEAISASDEKKIEQIVRRVLRDKYNNELILRKVKSCLVALFKALYFRRTTWKDMVNTSEA